MIIPRKLKAGDDVRIIAPSCTVPTMRVLNDELLAQGKAWFEERGMTVSEGSYIREINEFGSTTIEHRLKDLHDAFRDPSVRAMVTIRGGWNVNQLLPYIDYGLIKKNPKILCGFSDITALSNAIYAKTGLVTYSGPNFSQFCYGPKLAYTYEHFEAALLRDEPLMLKASEKWTDAYFAAGKPWPFRKNPGWRVLGKGKAEGICIGGNLCTLSLLQGTEYMPTVGKCTILLVEDDHETHPRTFDRDLTSLTQQPWFYDVTGVLFGRFQGSAVNTDFGPVTDAQLKVIVANNKRLAKLPIISGVDFGHTYPSVTFPIGGTLRMDARATGSQIEILTH